MEPEEDCFKGLLPSLSKKAYVLAGYAVADAKKIEDKGADKEEAANGEEAPKTDTAEKNELAEPTPKDLAEFVKDPFTAILKKRLGIAVEGYRDKTLEEASPLGVPKGPTLWDLQKELVKGGFDTAFSTGQKEALLPCEFLGEFARQQFDEQRRWCNENITNDVRAALEPAPENCVVTICRKFDPGTRERPITLPPDAVLEPLFVRLARFVQEEQTESLGITINVINVDAKKIGTWMWNVSRKEASEYYEGVRNCYRSFLVGKHGANNTLPYFTYAELRKYLRTAEAVNSNPDWMSAAKSMVNERNDYHKEKGKSFNSGIVIKKVTDEFKRDPTANDLIDLFNVLYWLPLFKKKAEATAANGGAR